MFTAHEVAVDAPYEVARARLARLIAHGALHDASEDAYETGLQPALRVGPLGDMPGLSKLVRVRALEPVERDGAAHVTLRWEATGVAGDLFPVLDADLALTRDGDARCRLELLGSYRPPFGRAGTVLDRAVMGRVASATVRAFVAAVADAVAHPAPDPRPAETPALWQHFAEPGET